MRNKLSQTLGLFWLFIFFIQAVSQNADAQSSSNSDIDNRLKRLELEIKDLHIHLFSEQRSDSVSKKIIKERQRRHKYFRKTSLSKNRFCGEYDS